MPHPEHWEAPLLPSQKKFLGDLPIDVLVIIVQLLDPSSSSTAPSSNFENLKRLSLVNKTFRCLTVGKLFSELTLTHRHDAQPLKVYGHRIETLLASVYVLPSVRHLKIQLESSTLYVLQPRQNELGEVGHKLTKVLKATCSTLKSLELTFDGTWDWRPAYWEVLMGSKIEFSALESLGIDARGPNPIISRCPNLKRLNVDASSVEISSYTILTNFQIALKRMKRLSHLENLGVHNLRDRRVISEIGNSKLSLKSFNCARNAFSENDRGVNISLIYWLRHLYKLPNLTELFLPETFALGSKDFRPPSFEWGYTYRINQAVHDRCIGEKLRETCIAARWAFNSLPQLEKLWIGSENLGNDGKAYTRSWLREKEMRFKAELDIERARRARDLW